MSTAGRQRSRCDRTSAATATSGDTSRCSTEQPPRCTRQTDANEAFALKSPLRRTPGRKTYNNRTPFTAPQPGETLGVASRATRPVTLYLIEGQKLSNFWVHLAL